MKSTGVALAHLLRNSLPDLRLVVLNACDTALTSAPPGQDPFGGVAATQPDTKGHWQKLPQTTIDLEVAQRRLPPPYLIKLDTHGYELPILAGSQATLAQTEALIVECYNFDIAPEARRFPAFCQHMESLGFRCLDLWDPLYRPGDGALWQFDLLFVRTASPAFAQNVYR